MKRGDNYMDIFCSIIIICVGIVVTIKSLKDRQRCKKGFKVIGKSIKSIEEVLQNPVDKRFGKSEIVYRTTYETEINGQKVTFIDKETTSFPLAPGIEKDFFTDANNIGTFYNEKVTGGYLKTGIAYIIVGIFVLIIKLF